MDRFRRSDDRNLDRRVEALVRITAPEQIDELIKYVDLQMAIPPPRGIAADGTYVRHAKDEEGRPLVDSQEYLTRSIRADRQGTKP